MLCFENVIYSDVIKSFYTIKNCGNLLKDLIRNNEIINIDIKRI